MRECKKYRFMVVHPEHGEAEVIAADRYGAVLAAAKEWRIRWTTIAKDCEVFQLGHAPVAKQGQKRK